MLISIEVDLLLMILLIEMEAATPGEKALPLDPGADLKWTKTKNATSRGNVFETNILLASPESVRCNENQPL